MSSAREYLEALNEQLEMVARDERPPLEEIELERAIQLINTTARVEQAEALTLIAVLLDRGDVMVTTA